MAIHELEKKIVMFLVTTKLASNFVKVSDYGEIPEIGLMDYVERRVRVLLIYLHMIRLNKTYQTVYEGFNIRAIEVISVAF